MLLVLSIWQNKRKYYIYGIYHPPAPYEHFAYPLINPMTDTSARRLISLIIFALTKGMSERRLLER
jgi:hypothetical protein